MPYGSLNSDRFSSSFEISNTFADGSETTSYKSMSGLIYRIKSNFALVSS